jgi:hypothetical protein
MFTLSTLQLMTWRICELNVLCHLEYLEAALPEQFCRTLDEKILAPTKNCHT